MISRRGLSIQGIIIILIFFVLGCQGTALKKFVRPSETFCFTQDMPKHTLYNITISSEYTPIRIQIMQGRQILMNTTTQQNEFGHQMTTQKFGVFKFCMTNMYHLHQMISFRFTYGARAKDFGTHQDSQDYLQTLQNQARIALMFVDQIKQENKEALILVSEAAKLSGGTQSIQYFFTIIFIGVIAICTYVQYKTIRQHMLSRKYI